MNLHIKNFDKVPFFGFYESIFSEKTHIHVWLVDVLKLSDREFSTLESYLCEEEKDKASRFHFEKDRKDYLAAHGVLRLLISKYLDLPISGIHIEKGVYGKPFFKGREKTCQFNLSHSHGKVALAFSFDGKEVGIDIEKINRDFDYQSIVDRFFSPNEQKTIQSIVQFYRLWTQKEALLKAMGVGMADDLTGLDVSKSGRDFDFKNSKFLPFYHKVYSLNTFCLDDYYVTLAVEGMPAEFKTVKLTSSF